MSAYLSIENLSVAYGAVRVLDHVSHVTVIAALAGPLRGLAPVREEVTGFVLA